MLKREPSTLDREHSDSIASSHNVFTILRRRDAEIARRRDAEIAYFQGLGFRVLVILRSSISPLILAGLLHNMTSML